MTDLLTAAKCAARDVMNELAGPGDDIPPALVMQSKTSTEVMRLEMPPSDEERDVLADFITALIAVNAAEEAIFVCTAWIAEAEVAPDGTIVGSEKASQRPNRSETAVLSHQIGDVTELWLAKITRHENRPPDMGLWEKQSPSTGVGGRFADALRMGVKLAKAVPEVPGLADSLAAADTPDKKMVLATVLVDTLYGNTNRRPATEEGT